MEDDGKSVVAPIQPPEDVQVTDFVFPKKPSAAIIKVTNIHRAVTTTQLRNFFLFCGEIRQISTSLL